LGTVREGEEKLGGSGSAVQEGGLGHLWGEGGGQRKGRAEVTGIVRARRREEPSPGRHWDGGAKLRTAWGSGARAGGGGGSGSRRRRWGERLAPAAAGCTAQFATTAAGDVPRPRRRRVFSFTESHECGGVVALAMPSVRACVGFGELGVVSA